MKLLELHAENFRSWKELHLVDLDDTGLCLITGKNGAGKSSIRHLIEYLLTDNTSDDLSLDEIPRDGKESCMLKGVIEKDGDLIEITKYRNHSKFENNTIISINGDESVTETDRRLNQKKIEQILGITSKSLFASSIFSSTSVCFSEAKEADRKQILYDAHGLEKYVPRNEFAKKTKEELKSKLNDIKDKIDNCSEYRYSLNNDLTDLKDKKSKFKESKRKKIADLLLKKDSFVLKEWSDLDTKIIKLKECLIEFISDPDEKIEELKSKIESLDKTLFQLNVEKTNIIGKIKEAGDGICPIFSDKCGRLEDSRKSVFDKYQPLQKEIEDKYKILYNDKTVLSLELDQLKDIKSGNDEMEEEIEDLISKIDKIKSYNESIEQRKDDIDEQIKGIAKEEDPYDELIEKCKNKIELAEKQIEGLETEVEKIRENIPYYEFWEVGFSRAGIPNMKVEGFLDALETSINNYLTLISDRMSVSIDSQSKLKSKNEFREKISYTVNHPDKKITNYKSYSSGQRQRVKIADIFSFHSLTSGFDFLVLDEVLEMSLDNDGIENVIDLLRIKSKEIGSLFVISHNDQIKDQFDKVINIECNNGISEIKEL